MKKDVTKDTIDIQRIIKDYSEQLYASKMYNMEEMDKLVESYNLPRLKGICQGCILSPCLFNSYAEYIMRNKHKLELRLLGEISITSDMQMTTPLWQKVNKN